MDYEIIERCIKELGNNLASNSKGDCLLIATDNQVKEMVIVVIKAMREPTDKMLDEGWYSTAYFKRDDIAPCWQAMIDAVIND